MHYREHVERFGSIPQYSTDVSELAHVRQVKEAYRASNKVDAAMQILDYRGRRLALEIRILNLKDIVGGPESIDDILWSHRDDLKELLDIFKIEDRKKTPNERSIVESGLPLKRLCNPSAKSERLFNVADGLQMSHMTLYRLIKEYAEDAECSQSFAGSSESILERRIEVFTCLQVPITIFQRPDVYEVHNIRCTGTASFRKGKIRKDWAWVSVGSSEQWGVFRGRLPERVEALFKVRDRTGHAHRLCVVELLEAKDHGIADSSHGLLKFTVATHITTTISPTAVAKNAMLTAKIVIIRRMKRVERLQNLRVAAYNTSNSRGTGRREGRIDLDTIPDNAWRNHFRFTRLEINQLVVAFRLPDKIIADNGICEDSHTALCMMLARLAYPNRICDMWFKYGWSPERISRVSATIQQFIHDRWYHLLDFDEVRLTPAKLEEYALAIHSKGAPIRTV
ncbi:hypothetical protein DFP73DRAFT_597837 [Morchella snyderi]|nr:hypothetical protein DFP73DRAFT_597837 [Morchella snyderi]